jgi:hypothetical protein
MDICIESGSFLVRATFLMKNSSALSSELKVIPHQVAAVHDQNAAPAYWHAKHPSQMYLIRMLEEPSTTADTDGSICIIERPSRKAEGGERRRGARTDLIKSRFVLFCCSRCRLMAESRERHRLIDITGIDEAGNTCHINSKTSDVMLSGVVNGNRGVAVVDAVHRREPALARLLRKV